MKITRVTEADADRRARTPKLDPITVQVKAASPEFPPSNMSSLREFKLISAQYF